MIDAALKKIIELWGKDRQMLMLLEEMSELQKEVLKNINRGRDNVFEIADEAADVFILMEQLVYIYGIRDLVEERKKFKLERLKRNLENDKKASSGN